MASGDKKKLLIVELYVFNFVFKKDFHMRSLLSSYNFKKLVSSTLIDALGTPDR